MLLEESLLIFRELEQNGDCFCQIFGLKKDYENEQWNIVFKDHEKMAAKNAPGGHGIDA